MWKIFSIIRITFLFEIIYFLKEYYYMLDIFVTLLTYVFVIYVITNTFLLEIIYFLKEYYKYMNLSITNIWEIIIYKFLMYNIF